MKDWSDLEEKYQDMRLADPKAAQSFKQRMTARFQVSHLSCDALISSLPIPTTLLLSLSLLITISLSRTEPHLCLPLTTCSILLNV